MTKKAQLGSVDLISVIVLAVVVAVFIILLGLPGCSGKKFTQTITSNTEKTMQAEGKMDLITYLRGPVEISIAGEKKIISTAEAISIRAKDEAVSQLYYSLLAHQASRKGYAEFIKIYEDVFFREPIRAVEGFQELLSTAYIPSNGKIIKVELYGTKGNAGEKLAQRTIQGVKYFSGGKTYVYWSNMPGMPEWAYGEWALDGWPCEAEAVMGAARCINRYEPTLEKDRSCFVDSTQFSKFGVKPPKEGCWKKDPAGNAIAEYAP